MIARGFACIGLYRPKTAENVGSVLRAAHCYRVAQVNIEGGRNDYLRHATNTPMAHRHTPTFLVDDVLAYVPFGTQVVAVDLIPGAVPLTRFEHPERAIYLFGPEDGTLGARHTDRAHHIVYVPTRGCMNLGAAVNVVLYDRLAKRGTQSENLAQTAIKRRPRPGNVRDTAAAMVPDMDDEGEPK